MVYLAFSAIDWQMENSIGSMGFVGQCRLSSIESETFSVGSRVRVYVYGEDYGEYVISKKQVQNSIAKLEFEDKLASVLRRFVKEILQKGTLYDYYLSKAGSIDLHWYDYEETITMPSVGSSVKLKNVLIKPNSVVVQTVDGLQQFVEGQDYSVNYRSGVLTNLNISEGTEVKISYKYYGDVDLEDVLKYLILKYVGLNNAEVDEFERVYGEQKYKVRSFSINNYLFDVISNIMSVAGGKVWVDKNMLKLKISNFDDNGVEYSVRNAKIIKRELLTEKLVNDAHVYGKVAVVSGEESFAGDGVTASFMLTKKPKSIEKVMIYFDDLGWTEVPYYDENSGEERYRWNYDTTTNLIVFEEAPPITGASAVEVFKEFSEWMYAYEIKVTNPNSEDVYLSGKIVIGDVPDWNGVGLKIDAFDWNKVKSDGSDIIFVMFDNESGKWVKINRFIYQWNYGKYAEIWFGGRMYDSLGNEVGVFKVPANSSATVYMLFGNSNANEENKVAGFRVIADAIGKFNVDGVVKYTYPPYIDWVSGSSSSVPEYCQAILENNCSDECPSYGLELDDVTSDYRLFIRIPDNIASDLSSCYSNTPVLVDDSVILSVDSEETMFIGEFIAKLSHIWTDYTDTVELSIGSFEQSWEGGRDLVITLDKVVRQMYSNKIDVDLHIEASINDVQSPTAELYFEYMVVRVDGEQPCQYSLENKYTNLEKNIMVRYEYEAYPYYNARNEQSIEKYGYRSANYVLNYVESEELLKEYGETIVNAFGKYLQLVELRVKNFEIKDVEIGEIVTLAMDDGKYKFVVNSMSMSNTETKIELIQVPENYKQVLGVVGAFVLFNVSNVQRIRNLEVGGVDSIVNVG